MIAFYASSMLPPDTKQAIKYQQSNLSKSNRHHITNYLCIIIIILIMCSFFTRRLKSYRSYTFCHRILKLVEAL